MALGFCRLLSVGLIGCLAASASASETVTFTYDALGRLTATSTSGGVANGQANSYTLDKADNRTAKTVSGATGGGVPDVSAILLPLNGITIIPVLTTP